MKFVETKIPGCFLIVPSRFEDRRGVLTKVFKASSYVDMSLPKKFVEEYYSISHKGVLRGMHFQVPPHDHVKLVYCAHGAVLDAILDLRVGSPTYRKSITVTIDVDKGNAIYIPQGCAHGFYTLSESATMIYKTSSEYHPESDAGVRWSSVGVNWPGSNPVLSDRDSSLPAMAEFESPFTFVE